MVSFFLSNINLCDYGIKKAYMSSFYAWRKLRMALLCASSSFRNSTFILYYFLPKKILYYILLIDK